MAQIGFNIPLITEQTGEGWKTRKAPPRPTQTAYPSKTSTTSISPIHTKPVAVSVRREIRLKETESVVCTRRFFVSESLEHSRKWYQREIEAQMKRGGLFEDPFMPPVDSTIWSDRNSKMSTYKWRRPMVCC